MIGEKEGKETHGVPLIIDAAIFSEQVVPIAWRLAKITPTVNLLRCLAVVWGSRPFHRGVGPLMTAHGGLVLLGPRDFNLVQRRERELAPLMRVARILSSPESLVASALIIEKREIITMILFST